MYAIRSYYANDINYTIETFNIDNDKFELNKQGLKVDVYSDCIKPKSIVSEFKTLNSLHSVLAQTYAAERNLDDVLFVDSDGNITESSNSNVFLLTDNKLFVITSYSIHYTKLYERTC